MPEIIIPFTADFGWVFQNIPHGHSPLDLATFAKNRGKSARESLKGHSSPKLCGLIVGPGVFRNISKIKNLKIKPKERPSNFKQSW